VSVAVNPPQSRLPRTLLLAILAVLGAVAFTVPVFGFGASLAMPFLAQTHRQLLWPRTSPATGWICSSLVVVGLWWTSLVILLPLDLPFRGDAVWLLIPLCAPDNASTWLIPASMATATFTLGLAATAWLHRPWPWLLGAWLAPLAYEAAMGGLVHPAFSC
jgi:hypothetical protein